MEREKTKELQDLMARFLILNQFVEEQAPFEVKPVGINSKWFGGRLFRLDYEKVKLINSSEVNRYYVHFLHNSDRVIIVHEKDSSYNHTFHQLSFSIDTLETLEIILKAVVNL